ncbi:hypothetical protein J6590_091677 [Homalodisca vitripennis]|nr:hypothetical protein J6590_091677 [Homalodisca vitripennis]
MTDGTNLYRDVTTDPSGFSTTQTAITTLGNANKLGQSQTIGTVHWQVQLWSFCVEPRLVLVSYSRISLPYRKELATETTERAQARTIQSMSVFRSLGRILYPTQIR